MKTISIFLALINAVIAAILLAASLTGNELHEAPVWWLLTKTVAALFVIGVSALAWLANIRTSALGAVAMGSLLLVALGPVVTVWTIHLSILYGDMEFYMAMYGGSLFLQGVASLLGFAGESRNALIS